MKKRILALCLACLLAASMTACGDSSTTESSKTSSKTASSSAVSGSTSESKSNSENTSESNSQADSSSQESNDKKKVKKQTSDEVLLKKENWGIEGDKLTRYTVYKYELNPETGNYIRLEYEAVTPDFEEKNKTDIAYEYDKDLRLVANYKYNNSESEKRTIYKYEFDEVGNVIKQSEYEPDNPDRASYYTTYEYDDEGNCIKEELYRGSSIQTSYTREYENGVLSKETQLTGSGDVVFISEFDEKGHVVKDGRGTYTYEYFDDGGYKQTSDRGDYKIYNSKEQLIEEKEMNNFLFKYTYGKIS